MDGCAGTVITKFILQKPHPSITTVHCAT